MQEIAQAFPDHIYEMAREQQVGTPLKVYRRPITKGHIIFGSLWTTFYVIMLVLSIQSYFSDKKLADEPPLPILSDLFPTADQSG